MRILTTILSQKSTIIQPMHAVSTPVHQWIALQAKEIWSQPEFESYFDNIINNDNV